MPLQSTYKTIGPIGKHTTFRYAGQLVDDQITPAPIPAASLTSVTGELTDLASGAVINGWDGTKSLLNANGCTIDSSGNLSFKSLPADSPVLDTSLLNNQTETHELVIRWTYNGGADAGEKKVRIVVEQYSVVAD
jgi:hypothetical protein